MDRRKQLTVFLIPLFSALVFASAQDDSPPCDPILLARMAASCVGYLVEPPGECCQMVVAAVGLGYGDPVPCLCRVVKKPDFPGCAPQRRHDPEDVPSLRRDTPRGALHRGRLQIRHGVGGLSIASSLHFSFPLALLPLFDRSCIFAPLPASLCVNLL